MAYKAVFLELYQLSDEAGEFELKASRIAEQLGFSRRAVYNAIAFLQRVNLLKLIESRTGRGNHSRYFLNWRKPSSNLQKHSERAPKQHPSSQQNGHENIHAEKCADISINKTKTRHISYDRKFSMAQRQNSQNPKSLWGRMMKSFRKLIQHSWLMKSEQNLCVGVLGRYLKNKSEEYARALYHQLAGFAHLLDVPGWVSSANDLCRWFMGVVKGASKRIDLECAHE